MSASIPLPLSHHASGEGQLLSEGEGGARIMRTLFPNGVRVLTEHMPNSRSVTVGFWVGVGSRDELPGHEGSTHFLEHLLFKGTAQRSALQIAESFDAIGGESNAATAKESTCYYARVLSRDLPVALETITDMVTGSLIDSEALEQERLVILEELAMDADDPSDLVHERFAALVMGDHPLGRPIGGTPQTIKGIDRAAVLEHYRAHYRPQELVITAAGGVDHDQLCALVVEHLQAAEWDMQASSAPVPRRSSTGSAPAAQERFQLIQRPCEQAHLVLGMPSFGAMDPRRYALSVFNAILGGGMSSRLFQEVRERRGLAYSVYSFSNPYSDVGYFGIYAGCSPAKVPEVIEVIRSVLEEIVREGVSQEELERARGQIAGSTVMALEDHGARMSRLARAEMVSGEFIDADFLLSRIDAVTIDEILMVSSELLSQSLSCVVVSPLTYDQELKPVLSPFVECAS